MILHIQSRNNKCNVKHSKIYHMMEIHTYN